MQAPRRRTSRQPRPAASPAEIPEDVRAELETPTVAAAPVAAEPIPEDVLAELDASARAAQQSAVDADLRPVGLDDDSEY